MAAAANPIRGEVDIELGGEMFVLRPTFEAIVEVESATGKAASTLAILATDSEMTLNDATIITTEFIRAWGRAIEKRSASMVDRSRIGELIMERGLLNVTMRLSLVLLMAVTGGCKADGTPKEGEPKAPGKKAKTLGADSQA